MCVRALSGLYFWVEDGVYRIVELSPRGRFARKQLGGEKRPTAFQPYWGKKSRDAGKVPLRDCVRKSCETDKQPTSTLFSFLISISRAKEVHFLKKISWSSLVTALCV
jgi:hypothetical protein